VGDKAGIASALASMGYVNGAIGNSEAAGEFLRRSLSLSESVGDKGGAAYALINMGSNALSQGDYARALENYERSLEINQSLGNKSGIATALNNIGIVYRMQGNYAQALEYYERSLRLSQETGGRTGTARVLNSIGNVFFDKGEYSVAIDYFKRSLAIYEEVGDKAGIPTELDNIGCALAGHQDYSGAVEYLKQSLALTESGNLRAGTAGSLEHLALVRRAEGKYVEALDLAHRSEALAVQVGSAETALGARLTAARAHLGLNQPDDARRDLDDSIAAIETMRSTVAGTEQEQERFFEGNLYPYQAMVALLVSQGKTTEALMYAERAKGRALLDVLTGGKARINKAMTREEQERERSLTGELASVNTQIYREQQQALPDPGRLDALKARLQKARLEREAFETSLYAVHPELRVKRGESRPVDLEEAGALIGEAGVALLEYLVTEEKTYVFALTMSDGAGSKSVKLAVHTIDISAKELDRRVEQFRQTLANQNYAFQKPALELYQLLLKPVEAQLKGQSA